MHDQVKDEIWSDLPEDCIVAADESRGSASTTASKLRIVHKRAAQVRISARDITTINGSRWNIG